MFLMKTENIPADIKSKSIKQAKEEISEILSKLEQLDPQNKKSALIKDPRWEKLESLL